MNHKKSPAFRRVNLRSKSISNSIARPTFPAWLLCLAVLVCGGALQTKAQTAGTLDATFGSGGKVVSSPSGAVRDLALQPDGKIIAGGIADGLHHEEFGVVRYNANGTVDTSFGNSGLAQINFDESPADVTSSSNKILAVSIQPDGKILASGYKQNVSSAYDGVHFAVARFNANGSLDTSFGTGGKLLPFASTNLEKTFGLISMILQPDGKFVLAAATNTAGPPLYGYFILARFNSDGSSDASFGSGGVVTSHILSQSTDKSAMYHLALQPDGKILACGGVTHATPEGATQGGGVVLRYNADGSPDNTFASGGVLIFDQSAGGSGATIYDTVSDVRIEPDGKIIAAGRSYRNTNAPNTFLMRLNSGGTLDSSFGTNGIAATNFYPITMPQIRRQLDGKYLVGHTDNGVNRDFQIMSFNNNGTTDTSFNSSVHPGFTETDFGGSDDYAWAILLQPDGKVILGGSATIFSPQMQAPFALARYNVGNIVARRSPFDFDGDGKSDLSIFRPAPGEWWYQKSSNGGNGAFQFGTSTDKLVPADFTGDGKTDIAFFRPATGEWFVLRSEDNSFYSFPFGTSGDVPQIGDFDFDGKADATVYRPSNSTWFTRRSTDGGATIQGFGQAGDAPVVADYDGDGRADIAIFRPSSGQWWINRSTMGGIAFQFGNSADKAVPGDYTGDGKTDVAFFRPSTGEWFVLRSENQSYYSFPFGINGDAPAPGDYDGDGKFDAAVYRPSSSTWYVQRTTAGTLIQGFGQSGDKPLAGAFVP
jgi:uncharacterized delta-60 repeat protein